MANNPLVSWIFMLGVAAAVVYVYFPHLIQQYLPQQAAVQAAAPEAVKTANKRPKARKNTTSTNKSERSETFVLSNTTATEAPKSKKRKIISAPVDKKVQVTTAKGDTKEIPRVVEENDVTDKEFAQQLAKAQSGTNLSSKNPHSGSSKAALSLQPAGHDGTPSGSSSTAGRDADDDLSPINSPQQRAVSGNDISDMLEKPSAAPTSLRLTNIPESKKQSQKPQQFEQVLSKKKRNEQAKREEQKRLREESDRLHEQKKQEQLRRARMAAGTSNQTKANNFTTAQQTNAWTNKPATPQSTSQSQPNGSLLNTFDHTIKDSVTTQPASAITNDLSARTATDIREKLGSNKTDALAASGREGLAGNMSEEEQMEKLRAQEDESAWESVTSKKTRKQNAGINDTSSEASTSAPFTNVPGNTKASHNASRPQINGKTKSQANGVPKPATSQNRFDTIQISAGNGGLQDDEWAA